MPVRLGGRPNTSLAALAPQIQIGALDRQVTLELGHRVDHTYRHATSGACEVDPTQRQAMDPHAHLAQPGKCSGDVDRVSAEPVQLG
jgi:hypothetical protein